MTLFIGIIHETLPEAQRTQGIWSIYNSNHFSNLNHFDIILTKREDQIYLLWYQLRKHGKANVKRKVLIFGRGPCLRRLLSSLIHCHCYSSPPSCQPTCVYPIDWNAHWHCHLVLSWYLHQLESHQLSLHKGLVLTQLETLGPVDQTPGIPGSDIYVITFGWESR